jgi:hypothetical protein
MCGRVCVSALCESVQRRSAREEGEGKKRRSSTTCACECAPECLHVLQRISAHSCPCLPVPSLLYVFVRIRTCVRMCVTACMCLSVWCGEEEGRKREAQRTWRPWEEGAAKRRDRRRAASVAPPADALPEVPPGPLTGVTRRTLPRCLLRQRSAPSEKVRNASDSSRTQPWCPRKRKAGNH